MRSYLVIAALIVASRAAVANEAFIPQSAAAIGQDLAGRATAASTIAVPLTPAAFKAISMMSGATSNLPSNVSGITQQGTKNLAVVGQTGALNRSTIAQTGSGNQATVTQRR
jgi:hypothetical protein